MNRVSRLITSSDFKAVLTRGKRISTGEFTLYCLAGPRLRVGIMVSKKVSKRAVARNKVKRQIRDIMSKNLPAELPLSLVVVAKPPILQGEYRSLKAALLSKVKMIELNRPARTEQKVARSSK